MDLLKEGVKVLSRRLNTSIELNSIDVPSSKTPSSCKSKNERISKQMVLNSKLELLGADKAIKVSYLHLLTIVKSIYHKFTVIINITNIYH